MIYITKQNNWQSQPGRESQGVQPHRQVREGFAPRLPAGRKEVDIDVYKRQVLRISGDTRDIDGGFVLTYGGIEENCSIDALFDAAQDVYKRQILRSAIRPWIRLRQLPFRRPRAAPWR